MGGAAGSLVAGAGVPGAPAIRVSPVEPPAAGDDDPPAAGAEPSAGALALVLGVVLVADDTLAVPPQPARPTETRSSSDETARVADMWNLRSNLEDGRALTGKTPAADSRDQTIWGHRPITRLSCPVESAARVISSTVAKARHRGGTAMKKAFVVALSAVALLGAGSAGVIALATSGASPSPAPSAFLAPSPDEGASLPVVRPMPPTPQPRPIAVVAPTPARPPEPPPARTIPTPAPFVSAAAAWELQQRAHSGNEAYGRGYGGGGGRR